MRLRNQLLLFSLDHAVRRQARKGVSFRFPYVFIFACISFIVSSCLSVLTGADVGVCVTQRI